MGHVEKSTGGIPLHTHVSRLSKPCERAESARPGNLGLVVFVGGKVCDTAHCVALHFDIRREHLPLEWFQAAQIDDEDLVVCVDSQVAESGAGSPLDLEIGALQQGEDRAQGVLVDLADIPLCNLGKCQTGTALQVDVVGVDECSKGSEGLAGEEVGLVAVLEVLEEISNCLAFTIGEDGLIEAIARFASAALRAADAHDDGLGCAETQIEVWCGSAESRDYGVGVGAVMTQRKMLLCRRFVQSISTPVTMSMMFTMVAAVESLP